MIDSIFWMRQRDLKQGLDTLAVRVTRLEMAMGIQQKRRTTADRLKQATAIGQMVITGHGLIPIILTAIGIGWKMVSKIFFPV